MSSQIELIVKALRRGVEENVRSALKNVDLPSKRDFDSIRKRIDRIASDELKGLKNRLDEVKQSLKKVESLKPYISAIEAATRPQKRKRTGQKTGKRKKRTARAKKAAIRRAAKTSSPRRKKSSGRVASRKKTPKRKTR